jgi:hypothetical protein
MKPKLCPWLFLLILLCVLARSAEAQPTFPGTGPTNIPMDSWTFYDHVGWTSDNGYSPRSFTNLNFSTLGDGLSLVVDTNLPAWLNYRVYETNGTTNLTVNSGTVTFWFAPNWASTNAGGSGPGVLGRLIEVGSYTENSSYGWWSLYVDEGGNNLYFSTQTNNLSSNYWTWLTMPISWTTNYFHFVALTYSPSNTSLYLDGLLATNGSPVTVYPGANALTNGFFIGSESNGESQAQGLFNMVAAYNYPMDSNDVALNFAWNYEIYMISPWNTVMAQIGSAPSSPAYIPTYDAISGQGALQLVGSASTCTDGTSAYDVWLTNITAHAVANGTMNVTFTIEGGASGVPYDVFANSELSFGTNGLPWGWMGQGYQCNTYTLTNLLNTVSNTACFLILGTPLDTSGFGLTDAYELLVEKVNPDGDQMDGYGVPYAWYAENGLSAGSATQDPDQDGLLNYQEYFYGTKPKVSEGFNIWISSPNGTTSIP